MTDSKHSPQNKPQNKPQHRPESRRDHLTGDEIAIVGMAGRFPGSPDVDAFWSDLLAGREGIVDLDEETLRAGGADPAEIAHPRYVKRAPLLAGHDRFDASFFGYSPLEAEVMDPQQRVLLEVAWQALEDAGHDPSHHAGPIGVFAGSKTNTYLFHLASQPEVLRQRDMLELILGGDQALLATRISYKLDLHGPSYAVQTACSSALVAIHLACRSLLLDECDMALAGGVALNVPHDVGYRYDAGGILSPDGRCRPFDADAAGTVFGSGAGMVVLRRLADAEADGDAVRAVILGSATNNDGSDKATFTAPSVEGQTQVILEALAEARVDADSIGLVEAHGTGTALGDPIEVLALKNAWRASTAERGFCALGSVKGNVGHLDAAAGMPGLVKAVRALETGVVPPTLHYRAPNPGIDFDDSPFFVAGETTELAERGGKPRRAAISSLGFGGTNAHLVLERAPRPEAAPEPPSRASQLLLLSGRTPQVVDAAAERLAARLEAMGEAEADADAPQASPAASLAAPLAAPLADVAWTLQTGRRGFEHRRAVVAADRGEAVERLRGGAASAVSGRRGESPRALFLFPGQGAQYPGMGRGLYDGEEVFRREVDRAAEILAKPLAPVLEGDLRGVLFPRDDFQEEAARLLRHTAVTQPALLAVEHALARQWMAWGIEPAAMIGHSIGEYAAAVLAGVFELEAALELVALRGRLMGALPAGAMASVALPAAELDDLLEGGDDAGDDGVELAAVNAPARSVVTGTGEAVDAFLARLREIHGDDVPARRLHTSHAFHSRMMEPMLEEFRAAVAAASPQAPSLPFVSNLSGDWITGEQATDPAYWSEHLRRPVRFAAGLETLLAGPPGTAPGGSAVLVETGPGTVLGTFAREVAAAAAEGTGASLGAVAPSLRHPKDDRDDGELLLSSLGRVWAAGLEPDWAAVHGGARRRRVPLPPYPFDVSGERHWIDLVGAGRVAGSAEPLTPQLAADEVEAPASVTLEREEDPADWLYQPAWRELPLTADAAAADALDGERWLLFVPAAGDDADLASGLAERLRGAGARVTTVEPANGFEKVGEGRYRVAADSRADHETLLSNLSAAGRAPHRVVHLWATTSAENAALADLERHGFDAVLALSQALAGREMGAELTVVSAGATAVVGADAPRAGLSAAPLVPERSLLLGPVKVLTKEHPEIATRGIDLDLGDLDPAKRADEAALEALFADLTTPSSEPLVAWRDGRRWAEGYERLHDEAAAPVDAADLHREAGGLLRDGGVYLVTGGLGGVGSLVAGWLAETVGARLVLTGRSELPARETWDDLVAAAAAAAEGDEAAVGNPTAHLASRVARVRELEAAGAEVLVVAADVADEAAMARVAEAAREHFGRVDGVVHAAGVAGGGLLQLKSREAARAVLEPKVEGARVLGRVFDALAQGDRPDFLLLVSSLQTVMADFGQVDYAGANAFLDAFAEARWASGRPTLAIDFDNFREVGILVDLGLPPHLEPWREELLGKALGNAEALDVLARVLARPRPRVAVSTQELAGRVELSRRLTRHQILRQLGGGDGGSATAGAAEALAGVSGGDLTRRLQTVWRRVLGLGDFDPAENFFDLGGDSLTGMRLVSEINRELGVDLSPVDLYDTPSVAALVERLAPEGDGGPEDDYDDYGDDESRPAVSVEEPAAEHLPTGHQPIAIVGMAGRFPGADGVDELWDNLAAGTESIRFFDDDELTAAGVPAEHLADPNYVKARPVLADVDRFDAAFFGYSPRDARILDPQHRLFLEHCWKAMENAGYDPAEAGGEGGSVGVFGGCSISSYLRLLWARPDFDTAVGELPALISNEKDSLTTHVSYKLDLRGPSVAVQSFCSTSLVAVHTACRSLMDGECDVALAGGVSVHLPQEAGYHYDPSGGVSRDGHLRAFDADASGYIFGNGVGVVVMKPLARALADGDTVRAVILGSSVNNDGSVKAGFTATAVDGQAGVIARALELADVDPASIGYVECHGSGTPLGDPVEIAALNRAFGRVTEARVAEGRGTKLARASVPVGSVKTNVGHLDRASGVTGLIKAVLTLERGEVPPSLHFDNPNPNVDFDGGPFYVNGELAALPRPADGGRRRVGVNSLGLGGTNVHVVLEEAPEVAVAEEGADAPPRRAHQLFTVSARSADALGAASRRLAGALAGRTGDALADAAWTLRAGRRAFEHRRVVVAGDGDTAAAALGEASEAAAKPAFDGAAVCRDGVRPPLVFLLSGLGSQYAGMGAGLYLEEPVFRRELDRCADILEPHLGIDLREVMYPDGAKAAAEKRDGAGGKAGGKLDLKAMLGRGGDGASGGDRDDASRRLDRTLYAQPALFAVEWAMARQWMAWGLKPEALLGYSLGEYVAAALAGVLRLPDALALVARRARLVDGLEAGAMLGLPLTPEAVAPYLDSGEDSGLSLAAVNGPEQSVVAGPLPAVEALEARLTEDGVAHRRVPTTHAFHSRMMEAIRGEIDELVAGFDLSPPRLPYLSNVTGTWITAEQVTDPGYWGEHACRPVLFAPAVAELAADSRRILLEVGPGQTLASLATQCQAAGGGRGDDGESAAALRTVPSLPGNFERRPDGAHLATALGKLWLLGCEPDWQAHAGGRHHRRVPLPTYPFERRRFWVDGAAEAPAAVAPAGAGEGLGPALPGAMPSGRGAPATAGEPGSPATLHVPGWRRGPALPAGLDALAAEPRHWLLLDAPASEGEDGGRLAAVADRLLDLGHRVTRVMAEVGGKAGTIATDGSEQIDEGRADGALRVDPASTETLTRLLAGLDEPVSAVLHGWSLAGGDRTDLGYRSLPRLADALEAAGAAAPAVDLWVLARGVYDVTGSETLKPLAATVLGPCQTLPLEHPELTCRLVELAAGEVHSSEPVPADRLLAEIAAAGDQQVVALRGGHRWLPVLDELPVPDKLPVPAAPSPAATAAGDGEAAEGSPAWLVLGGADGDRHRFAELLAAGLPSPHLLLAETGPDGAAPADGEGAAADRAAVVARLAEAGASAEGVSLSAAALSAALPGALASLVTGTAEGRGLAGVIVAPGFADALPAGDEDRDALPALADLLRALAAALAAPGVAPGAPVVLAASLAGPAGGGDAPGGLAARFARNLLFDTFAASRSADASAGAPGAPRWVSLSWEPWAAAEAAPATGEGGGIGAAEAAAFAALLAAPPASQVLVSARPLARAWNRLPGGGGSAAAAATPGEMHPRPELAVEYVAPRGKVEETIAGVWQELLGIERVGVLDDFLELGGDSLLASRMATRLSGDLGLDLPVRVFFEASTVEDLAAVVEAARAEAEEEERADLYARLSTMSDEEVLAELEKRGGDSFTGEGSGADADAEPPPTAPDPVTVPEE